MFKRLMILSVLALSSAAVAHADTMLVGTINTTGSATTNMGAETITFDTNFGQVVPTSDGNFAEFLGKVPVYSSAVLNYGSFSGSYDLFQVTSGSDTLEYDIKGITFSGLSGGGFTIDGTGNFMLNGGEITPGTFTFTTQPGGGLASFSITAVAAPEPGSLALFGTGLLGVVGIARRKFNV